MVVRWVNVASGALLAIAAFVPLIFLPDQIAGHSREPEDAWLTGLLIIVFGSLAALCFANAVHSDSAPRWLLRLNSTSILGLTLLLAIGLLSGDPETVQLAALCALGPLAVVLSAARHGVTQRS